MESTRISVESVQSCGSLNKKDPHGLTYLNVGPHLAKYFGKV